MNEALDQYRFEYKYQLDGVSPQAAGLYIKNSPFLFKERYKPRKVYSLYFDTPSYHCLLDNLEGQMQRYKIRLRWYNSFVDIKDAWFEAKIKTGKFNRKERIQLNIDHDISKLTYGDLCESIIHSLKDKSLLIKNLHPLSFFILKYDRSYFESASHQTRITVDSNLSIYEQNRFHPVNTSRATTFASKTIVEVKSALENDHLVEEILQHLPYRISKSSKYLLGAKAISLF